MSPQANPGSRSVSRLILTALLAATAWKAWFGVPDVLPTASAQIPDSGTQRMVLIEEIRKTNQLLIQLHQTIKTGTLKVRIEGTDNKTAPSRAGGVQ